VLTDAAINCRSDKRLIGLEENVIIGKLIPAGTGINRYRNIRVQPTEEARRGVRRAVLRRPVQPGRLRRGHWCCGYAGRLRMRFRLPLVASDESAPAPQGIGGRSRHPACRFGQVSTAAGAPPGAPVTAYTAPSA